jgi:hypothetical protein
MLKLADVHKSISWQIMMLNSDMDEPLLGNHPSLPVFSSEMKSGHNKWMSGAKSPNAKIKYCAKEM